MAGIGTKFQRRNVHIILLLLLAGFTIGIVGFIYWNNSIRPQHTDSAQINIQSLERPSVRDGFVSILLINNADEDNLPITNARVGLKIWDDSNNYSEICDTHKSPQYTLELVTDSRGILAIPNDRIASHACISITDISPRPQGPWHIDDLTGIQASTSHISIADGSAVDN